MRDQRKTKAQLTEELVELRQRIAQLQASEGEHKRAAETARVQRDKFESVVASLADGLDIVTRDYRVEYQTKVLRDRFGDLTGKLCYEGYMSRQTPCDLCPMAEAIASGSRQRAEMTGADGREYEVASTPFQDIDGETKVIEIVRDITERKRAEQALRESEERYRDLFDSSPVALGEHDYSEVKKYIEKLRASGVEDFREYFDKHSEAVRHCATMVKILDLNETALNLYEAETREELMRGLEQLFTEESYEVFKEELIAIAEGETVFRAESKARTLTGEERDIALRWAVVAGYEETLSRVVVSDIDITERRQMEGKVQHLNSLLRAIRSVNQLIVKEKDRDALLKGACDTLIETRGYHNAWIAVLDESGVLVTTAEAGLGELFLPVIERLKRGELTECHRRALLQSDVVATQDPPSVCADCPLAPGYGGRAAMTVQLEHAGKVYGLTTVSIAGNLAADQEEQALFEEVAGDIAFALHSIELDKERFRAEEALRESEERYRDLFDSSPVALGEHDYSEVKKYIEKLRASGVEDFREYFDKHSEAVRHCATMVKILDLNETALNLYEAETREELMRGLEQLFTEESYEVFKEELIAIAEGETVFRAESKARTLTGEERDIALRWAVVAGYEETLSRVVVSDIDITERKRAEREISRRTEELAALNAVAASVTSTLNLGQVAQIIEERAHALLGEKHPPLFGIFDETDETFEFVLTSAAAKLLARIGEETGVRLEARNYPLASMSRELRTALLAGKPYVTSDAADAVGSGLSRKVIQAAQEALRIKSVVGLPLRAKGRLVGGAVLLSVREEIPDSQLELLASITRHAAIAIDNARLYAEAGYEIAQRLRTEGALQRSHQQLQTTLEQTIAALAAAVEVRDPYTAGHQKRAADLAAAIAEEMGLSEKQIRGIRMAGAIHDIGKIQTPPVILSKPSTLTEVEWALIKVHPRAGYKILEGVDFPWPVARIVLEHHERMDGSGYPQGLPGEDICVEARILAVADVVEAMASRRPYRAAHPIEDALEEIQENRGILYDAAVVDACVAVIATKKFQVCAE